ncbi:MAG: DUF2066 domain-containing protein [Gammaproteobacteria bacterium]|nr:DUF2066 domain-containing protein [Gammaproteobacteria bacterium]
MRLQHLFLSLVLALLCPFSAGAAEVENLYRAVVPVEDHSARQLSRATRRGLAQVLVKVSGSREVLRDPEVSEALDRAQSYMQQYQYRRPQRNTLELEVQFDQQLVTEVLTQALLPLWSANRPPVLVWLVVDDATGRNFAANDSYLELLAVIRAEFQRRGVPVEFPLYDLQDTLAVTVHDLWQLNSLPIVRASRRYHNEDVLVGRLRALSDQRWMGDWLYLWENESRSITEYGEPLDDFVSSGVHLAAEAMAARYAVAPTGTAGDGILVRVDGLHRYADYRASLDHLEAVQLVDAAVVEYAGGDTVVFRVNAQLQPEQLQRVIALKGKLRRLLQFEPLDATLPAAELVYRWSP